MSASIVHFLDVSLNLETGKHTPYRKPNDTPLYINKNSNHPPNIIKQLPQMIQTRLSDLSSDAHEFNEVKDQYATALSNSGFHNQLKFSKSTPRKWNHKRNIIWFNPPYNQAVENNIGREFLSLINQNFPPHHKYRKIFNRNNVKLSYSCTSNIKAIISNHNKKILNEQKAPSQERLCNCRVRGDCPLDGQCLKSAITYKAVVDAGADVLPQNYFGATEPPFKGRYANHKRSLNKVCKRSETKLSSYIWELKDNRINADISWSVYSQSFPYRCGSRRCDLCLTEKLVILRSDPETTLNKRSEIMNKCRHATKFKLSSVK